MFRSYLPLAYIIWITLQAWPLLVSGQCRQVEIQANDAKGCAPHIVSMEVQNLPKNTQADWVLGSDTFRNRQTLSRAFRKGVTKDVTVVVKKNGRVLCTRRKPGLIQIKERPSNLQLSTKQQRICGGAKAVTFKVSAGNAHTVDWIVENERFADQGKRFTYDFQSPGPKTISVRATNPAGCTAAETFKDFIRIYPEPVTKINIANRKSTAPLNTKLALNTQDPLRNIQWQLPKAANVANPQAKKTQLSFQKPGVFSGFVRYTDQYGCSYSDTFEKPIRVVKPVKLNFQVSDKVLCRGEAIQLTVNNPVTRGSYDWKISSASKTYNKQGQVAIFKPQQTGEYSVTLIHKQNGVKQKQTRKEVFKVPRFEADFNASPACNCKVPVNITLNNQTTGSPVKQVRWTVTNDNGRKIFSSLKRNPSLRITKEGDYNVQMIAESQNGCKDTAYKAGFLQLGGLTSELDLDFETYAVNQPIHLAFPSDSFCTSDSLFVTWLVWDRQKTRVLKKSQKRNPTFKFKDSGLYKISLKVATQHGCQQNVDPGSKDNPVDVRQPVPDFGIDTGDQKPSTTKKDSNENHYCRNEQFRLVQQTVPTALNYTHQWKIQHQQYPNVTVTGKGEAFKTALDKPGVYDVIYTAKVDSITSFQKVRKGFLVVDGSKVNWEVKPQNHCIPYEGEVKAKLDTAWTHPNPHSSQRQTKWYRIDTPHLSLSQKQAFQAKAAISSYGIYDVGLKVTGPNGCMDRFESDNLLKVGLNAAFEIPDTTCFGQSATLTNESFTSNNHSKFTWSAQAGGQLQNDPNQRHNQVGFQDSGSYRIKLKVTDSNGCRDQIAKTTYVERVFTAFSSPDTFQHCAHAMVDFTTESSPNVERYHWKFGDGQSKQTNKEEITKLYTQNSGDSTSGFDVQMTAITSNGCRQTIKKQEYVTVVGPVIDFTVDQKVGCEPLKVSFDLTGKNYEMAFASYGDKSNLDTAPDLAHNYTVKQAGGEQKFKPFVLAKDQSGCYAVSEIDEAITVYGKPDARFSIDTTQGCQPVTTTLRSQTPSADELRWHFSDTAKTFTRQGLTDTLSRTFGQGRHDVSLVAETREGCIDTLQLKDTIKSFSYPSADFKLSNDAICPQTTFALNQKVDGNGLGIETYQWHIERTERTDTFLKPDVKGLSYQRSGTYDVQLTASNNKGCVDTQFNKDFIEILPRVDQAPNLQFVSHQKRVRPDGTSEKLTLKWETTDQKAFQAYGVLAQVDGNRAFKRIATVDQKSQTRIKHQPKANETGYYLMVEGQCGFHSDTSQKHLPSRVTIESPQVFQNALSWTPYHGWNGLAGYEIQRAYNGGAFKSIDTVAPDKTIYRDKELCRGDYDYQVVALHDSADFKAWSNPVVLSPKYERPRFENPLINTTVKDQSLVTSWKKPDEWQPEAYRLQRKKGNQGAWENIGQNIQKHQWQDQNLQIETQTYQYRVMAVNHCGEPSPQSGLSSSVLLNAKPKGKGVQLTWEAGNDWLSKVQSYEVQVKAKSDGGFQTLQTISGERNRYHDNRPHKAADTTLVYRVKAYQANGQVSTSNTASAIQASTVYIPNAFSPNNDGLNEEFKVEGQALHHLDGEGFARFQLTVFNRWGERVFQTSNPNKGWDGTSKNGERLGAGTYIYKLYAVSQQGQTFTKKGQVTLIR